MSNLVIWGSGGHGRVVADAAISSGWNVVGFLDDFVKKETKICYDLKVISNELLDFLNTDLYVIVAVGDNIIRAQKNNLLKKYNINIPIIKHINSTVSPSALIKEGSVIFSGAVINNKVCIGTGVIINTSVSLDHDSIVGEYAHVSPGVRTGGNVSIGDFTHVSIGCSIRNKISIGKNTIIGVGSVVVSDIPSNVVAYGCPAKIIRENCLNETD